MSNIVALREAIMASIQTNMTELAHVDWHDGAFDDDDIAEITSLTPAAYVTVLKVPTSDQLTTRQLNADLRIYVNLVCSDADGREERGSDKQVWNLMERLALLANLNKWGVPECAPANQVHFQRLRDPKLRREGVAVGVVEWSNGLVIGENAIYKRDYLPDPTTTLAQSGATFQGSATVIRGDASSTDEPVDVTVPADDPRHLVFEID